MNINIKTVNISLTPAIEDYLRKKLDMLNKVVDLNADNVFIQAELGKTTRHHRSGDVFRAEYNLEVGGNFYRASYETEELYAAIDMAKDELQQIVRNSQNKRKSLIRRGAAKLKNLLRFGKIKNE